jgi:hypothetical protein
MKKRMLVIGLLLLSPIICRSATIRVPSDQPTIQAGIDAAVNGDTVLVADGTYTGDGNRDLSFDGKAITVRSENGPESCTIDCEGTTGDPHRAFSFHNGEGRDSRLSGITITNGLEDGGGGISCSDASPTIDNCIITGNTTGWRGGGLWLFDSHALISGCTISDNQAVSDQVPAAEDVFGGGVYTMSGSPVFVNCRITGNTAEQWMYLTAEPQGVAGGIYAGPSTLINCLIDGNTANLSIGGGWFGSGSSLINCTITGNTADGSSGGIKCETGVSVTRCIAWNNTPDSITGSPTVTYSDVEGGHAGEGNINSDPLFVQGPNGNWYLSHTDAGQTGDSPCIDAGDIPSSAVCFETAEGTRCLDTFSTRTDSAYDVDLADLGFHYPGLECDTLGISLVISTIHLKPGDAMTLTVEICNPSPDNLSARVYLVLDTYGQFWFWPSWASEIDFHLLDLSPGLTSFVVFDFAWPDTGSTGNATCIALMTNSDGTDALGTWDLALFDWK